MRRATAWADGGLNHGDKSATSHIDNADMADDADYES